MILLKYFIMLPKRLWLSLKLKHWYIFMLKKYFVVFLFIFNSIMPSFAVIVDQNEFNETWNYSPLLKRVDNNSELQMKLFKKTMWINQTEVPVIETTFTYLKNPKEPTNLKQLALTIQKTFDKKNFKITNQGNQYKVSGPFKKLNRFVQIDLKSHDNKVLIITSFIRLGFYKNVKNEVEDLHHILLTYNGESTEKKTSWIKWIQKFVLVDAYAEGLNIGTILGGANTTTPATSGLNINLNTSGLQKSVDQLNAQIGTTNTQLGNANANWGNTNTQLGNTNVQLGNANTNWSNTNAQLGNANTNWNSTNNQIGNVNTNWNNTNNQIGNANNNWNNTNNQIGNANNNWNNTNTQLAAANNNMANFNKEYANMNTNWAESNKLLSQALDPNHMAKVAFYTAAGAALGGVAVNLAIQGVSSGISFLYELFTGAKKKKLEWEDLEKAMSVWDTQLNDLVKLEQAVDAYLAAFDFFDGKNLTNDYVKQLANVTRDMRFDRDLFMEKFKNKDLSNECRKIYYNAADELDQKLKEYERILTFEIGRAHV